MYKPRPSGLFFWQRICRRRRLRTRQGQLVGSMSAWWNDVIPKRNRKKQARLIRALVCVSTCFILYFVSFAFLHLCICCCRHFVLPLFSTWPHIFYPVSLPLSFSYIVKYCVGHGATVLYCGLSRVGVCLVNATAQQVKGQPVDQGGGQGESVRQFMCTHCDCVCV